MPSWCAPAPRPRPRSKPISVSTADAEQLEDALRNLPASQRVPLVLFHFESKSYVEIAALLRVSLAKVKTDIHRGREKLRSVLQASHASR